MKRNLIYITSCLILFNLFACSSNNSSIDDTSNTSQTSETSFLEAVNATKDNFQLDTYYYEVDNLKSYLNHYQHSNIRYDGSKSIYWKKYVTAYTEDKNEFEKLLNIDDNYQQMVFYLEDGVLQERLKNEEDVWKQFNYKPTFSFDEKITDYIIADHYHEQDGFYYLNDEYLGTEECSRLTGYYGSYSYLNQIFDYVCFSIKDGKLDEYKFKVKFTSMKTTTFDYDANVELTGKFSNIGTIDLKVPALPVYPEDLLPEQKELEEAKIKTEKNYTYNEKYSITDENGETKTYDFIEQVNNRSFRNYMYSEFAGCYVDSYTYDVVSISFSGGVHTTTYDTSLYYYDDHTEYYSNDMDIEDDSVSSVERIGSSFGTKIYTYNEEEKYYTPRLEKPERYNPRNETYLDYASKSFIHGIYGEYTTNEGVSYHYDFIDLKFYLNDEGVFSKASYEYDLTITEKGISKVYKCSGTGLFSNVGTTSFDIPTDPNNDIELDERLQGLYDSMNLTNYSYEETYSIYDDSDNKLELYGVEGQPVYDNVLKEKVNGRDVCLSHYGYVPRVDNQEEYDVEFVDEYYHYGDYNLVRSYKLQNYEQLFFNYAGTYKFTPCIEALKNYLKYFKFVRTRTINNQEAYVFSLPEVYAKMYGSSIVSSIDENSYTKFNSLNLTIIGNEIYQISYDYDYYNKTDYIGVCSGKIKINGFGTTEVNIPNFNENDYEVTTLQDSVNLLKDSSYNYKDSAKISYFSNRTIGNYTNINNSFNVTSEQENEYYLNDNKQLCLDMNLKDKDYTFAVLSKLDIDISKIDQSKFYCDSNGTFVLKSEYKNEFFKEVLPIEEQFGEGNVQPQNISIDANGAILQINLSYIVRFKLDDGSYVVFYITRSILISNSPIIM